MSMDATNLGTAIYNAVRSVQESQNSPTDGTEAKERLIAMAQAIIDEIEAAKIAALPVQVDPNTGIGTTQETTGAIS